MPRTIRFHPNEHCPTALAEGLRRRGIDVTTTPEVGLQGADDPDHVRFALAEGRVLFTQDEDFLAIHAEGISHPGIAYCQQGARGLGEIIRGLVLIWEIYDPCEMVDRVEFLGKPGLTPQAAHWRKRRASPDSAARWGRAIRCSE